MKQFDVYKAIKKCIEHNIFYRQQNINIIKQQKHKYNKNLLKWIIIIVFPSNIQENSNFN